MDASRAVSEALAELGEAAALRFTVTRLHDRIFHDPSKLVTPKDPAVFLRRMDHWRALERQGHAAGLYVHEPRARSA